MSSIKSIRSSVASDPLRKYPELCEDNVRHDKKERRRASGLRCTKAKTSGRRNSDSSPSVSPPPRPYITIDHRLGFAPRFYRFSNPSRYFCQLYHRLSPGVPVTRKQPGDIIRACPRKSIHSGWEFPHMLVKGLGAKFDIGGRLAALSTISISREIRSSPFRGILAKLLAIHIAWRDKDNVCVNVWVMRVITENFIRISSTLTTKLFFFTTIIIKILT